VNISLRVPSGVLFVIWVRPMLNVANDHLHSQKHNL
jgi:hypothetical protein